MAFRWLLPSARALLLGVLLVLASACTGSAAQQAADELPAVAQLAQPRDCERSVVDDGAPQALLLSERIDAAQLLDADALIISDLVVGDGCEARHGDVIMINYLSQNPSDGAGFHNSWRDGQPERVLVGSTRIMAGLADGLVGMKVGGERIVGIPPSIAFGESGLLVRVHLQGLSDAPYAHTVVFSGEVPTKREVTTIALGFGASAEVGDTLTAELATLTYSNRFMDSTWESGVPVELVLRPEEVDPTLFDGTIGVKVGEVRQIIVPATTLPDGVAEALGLEANDGIVYVLEAIAIAKG